MNQEIVNAIAAYLEEADWIWRLPSSAQSDKIAQEIAAKIEPLSGTNYDEMFGYFDKKNIHCSVYFADFGFPGCRWKYKVDWYGKDGRLISGNVGDAATRQEANDGALKVAKYIEENGYANEPAVIAFDKTTGRYSPGIVWQAKG
jgi:hypothetical protein